MRLHLMSALKSKHSTAKSPLALLAAGVLLCVQLIFHVHVIDHLSDFDEDQHSFEFCELCLSSLALDAASDSSTHPSFPSRAFVFNRQTLADQIRQRPTLAYNVRAPPLL